MVSKRSGARRERTKTRTFYVPTIPASRNTEPKTQQYQVQFVGVVRSERSQLAATDLISFNFFDFTESMYPSLCLRLYPRSTKIVADKLEGERRLRTWSLVRRGYQRRFLLVPARSSALKICISTT